MASSSPGYQLKPQSEALLRILASGPVRGRKRLQKLAYFLQEAEDQPLGFDFRMYFYGPYSPNLDARLQLLESLDLIRVGDEDGVAEYSINDASDLSGQPKMKKKIDRVLENFDEFSASKIELYATVHFLARRNADKSPQRLIGQLRAWKGSKFSAKQATAALDGLTNIGYL